MWLHTSWYKLDDSEGVKSITKLVIFHGELYDQYSHFLMALTTKWGNSGITLYFIWMGPTVAPSRLLGVPGSYFGGPATSPYDTYLCGWAHILWYKILLLFSAVWWHYTSLTPGKTRFKFPSIALSRSLSICPSLFHLSLRLCVSLGASVIPDTLKGLFRLISQTLIYD